MKTQDRPVSLRVLAVGIALAIVIGLPFALKPRNDLLASADETLTIITPHNEAVRHEFATEPVSVEDVARQHDL